jgi:hypothetical protein
MKMTSATLAGVPMKQEWNTRWLFVLIATALLAATAGYAAGGGRSTVSVLTGNAYAGIGQVSANASDGFSYSIPVDGSWWTDSKGSLHSNGRPECLPPVGKSGPVKFAAVQWTAEGMTQRSVVWVLCGS